MKKILLFVMILCSSLCLVGCKNNQLEKQSANLSTYDLSVELCQDMTMNCHETLNFRNNTDVVLNCLNMHLYPNAFREGAKYSPVSLSSSAKAYPNGKSWGSIIIENVYVKQKQIEFSVGGIDKNILEFEFGEEVYPNDYIKIDIDFTVTIPNCNHRFGYGNNTVNIANFYPIACVWEDGEYKQDVYVSNGDPFYSDMANYNVEFTCPSDYVVASSGSQIKSEVTADKKRTEITAKVIRDFAIVCSKKFQTISAKANDVVVNYFYYSDENPEQSLNTAVKSVQTFCDMIGEYPYEQLSVVETNFVHGGMEYPNLIYISDACSSYEEYTNVIVHETAHQWWYALVGNNEYSSSWVDEGLTEYTTALFYEKNPEYNKSLEDIVKSNWKSYSLFVSIYQNVLGSVDTTMNRELNQFSTDTEYVYIAYVKGMLIFDSVRQIIGDKAFFEGLKIYFDENKFKQATSGNIISAFEKSSGCDLESLFDSWIEGKIIIINQI